MLGLGGRRSFASFRKWKEHEGNDEMHR